MYKRLFCGLRLACLLASGFVSYKNFLFFESGQGWDSHLGYFAIILLILAVVDIRKYTTLKIGGVELQKTIEKAKSEIQKIETIFSPLARLTISAAVKNSRWGGCVSADEFFSLEEKFKKELPKFGTRLDTIEDIFTDFHKYNLFDLAYPIYNSLGDQILESRKVLEKKRKEKYSGTFTPDLTYNSMIENERALENLSKTVRNDIQNFEYKDLRNRLRKILEKSSLLREEEIEAMLSNQEEKFEAVSYYLDHKKFK